MQNKQEANIQTDNKQNDNKPKNSEEKINLNQDYYQNLTIKEIKNYCSKLEFNQQLPLLIEVLKSDSRKGVKKIAAQLQRKLDKKAEIAAKWEEMNQIESKLAAEGYQLIVGIDEAGRGPLAGPVVAAAVILDPEEKIYGLDDSKRLTKEKREELFEEIKAKAFVGVAKASSSEIDKYNIREATFVAMKRAVKNLLPNLEDNPDILLVDGNAIIPGLKVEQRSVIDGDAKVNAIAAASIIAKVTRDEIIFKYAEKFPQYDFKNNKGYGTAAHIKALENYGSSPIHRRSFARVPK